MGLVFATDNPQYEVRTVAVARMGISIPAHAAAHVETKTQSVSFDIPIMGFMPLTADAQIEHVDLAIKDAKRSREIPIRVYVPADLRSRRLSSAWETAQAASSATMIFSQS